MTEELMRVTAVDKEEDNGEVIIQLTGRNEDNKRRAIEVEGTIPYFYARASEGTRVIGHDDVREIKDGYESYDGIPLSRIDCRAPSNVGSRGKADNLTEKFSETWESDIPFYRRASLDYNLSGHIRVPDKDRCHIDEIETDVQVSGDEEISPRVFIADIEVKIDEGKPFDEMVEKAEDPITNITVWDSQEDEYIALILDPDEQIDTNEVGRLLDEHAGAESLSGEFAKDIILRRFKSEESMLSGFIDLCVDRRPDITSGWNFVDFDWEYMLSRFGEFESVHEHRLSDIGFINGYKTEQKVDCLPAFDMMDAYCEKMSWSEWRSKSLNYVSKSVLGIGKIPNIDINHCFEHNPDKLAAYNIFDVMLPVALDRVEGVHDFFYELAELSQIQIWDTMSEMRLVDGYIMSRADDDEILPPQKEKDIPENAGGLVLNPSDGIREMVGVLDLKSLYPSTIITWNISPETIHWYDDDPSPATMHLNVPWLPDADHADGGQFSHDEIDFDVMWTDMREEGLIPKYIKRLFPERSEKKDKRNSFDPDDELYDVWDRKQAAVKVIMNSFYGVMSNDYWRLGKHGLGDAVTSASRYALWQGKEVCQGEGYEVIYGDTDSVMVELGEEGDETEEILDNGKALAAEINDRVDECVTQSGLRGEHPFLTGDLHGSMRHCLYYEFEKLYERFFQAGKKKRYAGRIIWKEGKHVDGEIDATGFESERSDSPELTAEAQPEVINRILAGGGFDEVSDYIRSLIDDIENRDIDLYKVAIPVTLNQALDEYGNTQTARACRYSNKNMEKQWRDGDDPWMYFIDRTPPMTPDTDVLALDWDEDLPDEFELDINKTLERALEGPLRPIIDEVGWKFAELKKGAQTQSAASDWDANYDNNDNNEPEPENDWGF